MQRIPHCSAVSTCPTVPTMIRLSRRSLVDLGMLILVNAMWGAQFTAYKLVSSDMGPVTVSAWIFLIAGIVLAPFVIRERRRDPQAQKSDAHDSDNDRSLLSKRNLAGFVAISVFGLVPASAFMAWGVARSTASNSALINLTIPIITALLAVAMLGERMTAARWASLLVSLAGVLILSDFDWRHMTLTSNRFLLGNLLVLLSCACSSFYNVCSKELLRRFTPVEVLTIGYFLAALVSIPLLCWIEPFSLPSLHRYSSATWIGLILLGVFVWGLAMVLWMSLLKRLDVSQASVSVYLLPFLGVLISALSLGEKITGMMVLGGSVTLAGTILIVSLDR
jgi:drug/metabolite transporter (DMT)-like permease